MGTAVGTLAWADETGGRLRIRDRVGLLGQFALLTPLVPGEFVGRIRRAAPRATALRVDPTEPATAIALEAKALCQLASKDEPWLYRHCARTFHFGLLFAEALDVNFDREALWVAAMLHDIGLTDAATRRQERVDCFAVRGARMVSDLPSAREWSQRERAAEAIALHINYRISRRRSPEGYLINVGSGLDVVGLRYRAVFSEAMLEVVADNPRGDFARIIRDRLTHEAQGSPRTRARFLRTMGLNLLLASTPFRFDDRRISTDA